MIYTYLKRRVNTQVHCGSKEMLSNRHNIDPMGAKLLINFDMQKKKKNNQYCKIYHTVCLYHGLFIAQVQLYFIRQLLQCLKQGQRTRAKHNNDNNNNNQRTIGPVSLT